MLVEGGWALDMRRKRYSLVLGGKEDLTCANSMYTVLMFEMKGIKRSHQVKYTLVPHIKRCGSEMHMQISREKNRFIHYDR